MWRQTAGTDVAEGGGQRAAQGQEWALRHCGHTTQGRSAKPSGRSKQ